MLLLYAIPVGMLLGFVAGGRLAPLGAIHIRLWPLALAGLVFQVVLFSSPLAAVVGAAGPALYVGSTLVVLVALLANLRQPGFRLILIGALCNLAAIVANGGQMPASPEAFAALTGLPAVPTEHFTNSVLAAPGTPLLFLGDIFVLPRPIPFANVFSIGDVLIAAGGVVFIARCMTRPLTATPLTPPTVATLEAPPVPARLRRATHG
jgi:hypothetical protein